MEQDNSPAAPAAAPAATGAGVCGQCGLRAARTLRCGHSACQACLGEHARADGNGACPECRKKRQGPSEDAASGSAQLPAEAVAPSNEEVQTGAQPEHRDDDREAGGRGDAARGVERQETAALREREVILEPREAAVGARQADVGALRMVAEAGGDAQPVEGVGAGDAESGPTGSLPDGVLTRIFAMLPTTMGGAHTAALLALRLVCHRWSRLIVGEGVWWHRRLYVGGPRRAVFVVLQRLQQGLQQWQPHGGFGLMCLLPVVDELHLDVDCANAAELLSVATTSGCLVRARSLRCQASLYSETTVRALQALLENQQAAASCTELSLHFRPEGPECDPSPLLRAMERLPALSRLSLSCLGCGGAGSAFADCRFLRFRSVARLSLRDCTRPGAGSGQCRLGELLRSALPAARDTLVAADCDCAAAPDALRQCVALREATVRARDRGLAELLRALPALRDVTACCVSQVACLACVRELLLADDAATLLEGRWLRLDLDLRGINWFAKVYGALVQLGGLRGVRCLRLTLPAEELRRAERILGWLGGLPDLEALVLGLERGDGFAGYASAWSAAALPGLRVLHVHGGATSAEVGEGGAYRWAAQVRAACPGLQICRPDCTAKH